MTDTTLPRSVVEQALDAFAFAYNACESDWVMDEKIDPAMKLIQAALEQPQVEQEPAPNGATHRQPKQGAFYKRVDGKWYVWSRMENGEPHRWYISPGTSESCLEPLNAAAPQPPAVKDSLTAEQPQSVTDCHQSQPVAWILRDANNQKVWFLEKTSTPTGYRGEWIKTPLYTHPQPPRQPLTDEEVQQIWRKWVGTDRPNYSFARAIERAHGIRGEK